MLSQKLLVVDDDADIAGNLKALLSREGYFIETAHNGKSALEILNRSDVLPALILLDLMMPVMDGLQFIDAQKKDPRLSAIPVVLMTADANYKGKCDKVTPDAVLTKPFIDIDTILGLIKRFEAEA